MVVIGFLLLTRDPMGYSAQRAPLEGKRDKFCPLPMSRASGRIELPTISFEVIIELFRVSQTRSSQVKCQNRHFFSVLATEKGLLTAPNTNFPKMSFKG